MEHSRHNQNIEMMNIDLQEEPVPPATALAVSAPTAATTSPVLDAKALPVLGANAVPSTPTSPVIGSNDSLTPLMSCSECESFFCYADGNPLGASVNCPVCEFTCTNNH